MDAPTMFEPRGVSRDTDVLTAYVPVPGLGVLPISSYVVRAEQPVLIDCGIVALGDAFFRQIASHVALGDVRWIWLTHADPDHVGCLAQLLAAAPRAKLATHFLTAAKLGLWGHAIDPTRIRVIETGAALDLGDRRLVALAPPSFDSPETLAAFDTKSRFLFSADTFGALLHEPAESARDVPADALRDGLTVWAHIDAPWIAGVDAGTFARSLDLYRRLAPAVVLSSHLPPAPGMAERLFDLLVSARGAGPAPTVDAETILARAAPPPSRRARARTEARPL